MATIFDTCRKLSIDPSAFRRTLRAAVAVADAKKALIEAKRDDMQELREEGLTPEEELALTDALDLLEV